MGETPDHRLFIAMELLRGEDLSERIKRGDITPKEALNIARQVAGSLSEAHQMGVIHRDMKPDNIFLTTHNIVKVLDFGIAKLKDDSSESSDGRRLTKAGTAPGTPEYMSPEQARGKELDARSDLYSLGIVLYEMLCGHPPFEDSTFLGTILMQVQSPPPPLPNHIPQPLRDYVVNRLLCKDPDFRPADANCFIREIDEISRQISPSPEDRMRVQELERVRAQEEQLDRARAEIEALRNELAQTKRELQRSTESAEQYHAENARNSGYRMRSEPYASGGAEAESAEQYRAENARNSGYRMRSEPYVSGGAEPVKAPNSRSSLNQMDIDVNGVSSRPIETMTGRVVNRSTSSQSSVSPQTTFMMYAQPLCSKLGPQKVHEALHLAQGIWNAAVLGGQAIEEIYASAEGMPALIKLIEAMIIRKNKYFADEYWQIDNLNIETDNEGRLSIQFDTK